MMKLVIAEKPSVGMAYASVLGAKKRMEGFLEGKGYIVSWCFGHLAELASAEAYDEKYAKWRCEDLPIVPNPWVVKITHSKKKRFDLLRELMRREDVSEVINGCDAGREGELIFRYVYEQAGCKKPIKRLWLSSMEDEAIRDGFRNLRPGADYDRLYAAALCRAKADWLVGINATRLFSVLYHRTLNVGRVFSPTLALLVQRDADISAFKPEPYYTVNLTLPAFSAVSEKFREKSEAERVCAACANAPAMVIGVEAKEKSEKAPVLYDLTTLQREANRTLGYTAQQTLDYLQSLYEKKLVTYPRTDSRFLTDDMSGSVRQVAACAAGICGMDAPASIHSGKVCDSKKVTDHHAVIPTLKAGETDLCDLTIGEREILKLVARQVLIAVSSAYRFTETVVTLDCGGTTFTAKRKMVQDFGWKAYLDAKPEQALPELMEGQTIENAVPSIVEGKTKAPSAYTEDTLLHAMETAGVKDAPEDAERKGIGTPATRAAMIEKLVEAGFAERKQNRKTVSLVPTQPGISLITVLPEQLQSPLLTAEWEHKLKQIEYGTLDPDVFLEEITEMLQNLTKNYRVIRGAEVLFPSGREVIGKCPRCGSDVTESRKGYFCESNECRFGLWRDNKFLNAKRINLTRKNAEELLKGGKTYIKNIYSEKTGKNFDADLLLDDNGERTVYRFDFSREAS